MSILLRMLRRVDSFLEDLHFWMWIYFDCIPVVDIINHIGFFIGDLMEYIKKGRVE